MAKASLRAALASLFAAFALAGSVVGAHGALWDEFQTQWLTQARNAAGSVSVEVLALPSGRILWSHRAHEPMIPASLLKIATSYAALKTLGPGHRFRTALYSVAAPKDGTLAGDIWIKSEGDIFWTVDGAVTLVSRLKARGIEAVGGRVLVDNTYFSPPSERICLDDRCEDAYNPSLSGTAIEFNSVVLRIRASPTVGRPPLVEWLPRGRFIQVINEARTAPKKAGASLTVKMLDSEPQGPLRFHLSGRLPVTPACAVEKRYSVPNPPVFLAAVLTTILESAGIRVGSGPTPASPSGAMPKGARLLAEVLSPPLAETLHGLNRHSNNFMAEMLLRSMGAAVLGPPGTEAKGIATINQVLQGLGAPATHCFLKTGSGLSRECRMSAHALAKILVSAYGDPELGKVFMESLAVNGEEGTLKRRLSRSPVIVRGKTGTLRDVVGFAGYVSAPDRPLYGVVVLLNGVHDLAKAKEAVDALMEKLALSGPSDVER